jgi:hypothetical protein
MTTTPHRQHVAVPGIGLALTFGIGMRIAAVAGTLLYVLMWSAVLPPANNPVLDDHIVGAITLIALALVAAGNVWGLGKWSSCSDRSPGVSCNTRPARSRSSISERAMPDQLGSALSGARNSSTVPCGWLDSSRTAPPSAAARSSRLRRPLRRSDGLMPIPSSEIRAVTSAPVTVISTLAAPA